MDTLYAQMLSRTRSHVHITHTDRCCHVQDCINILHAQTDFTYDKILWTTRTHRKMLSRTRSYVHPTRPDRCHVQDRMHTPHAQTDVTYKIVCAHHTPRQMSRTRSYVHTTRTDRCFHVQDRMYTLHAQTDVFTYKIVRTAHTHRQM